MPRWLFKLDLKVQTTVEGRNPDEVYLIKGRQIDEKGIQTFTLASRETAEIIEVPAHRIRKYKIPYNTNIQYYKGIPLLLIRRGGYEDQMAKRYTLNGTNQNVWIPNKHTLEDGTLIEGENIDYVFRKSQRQLELSGLTGPIPGIKRTSTSHVWPQEETSC